VQRHQPRARRSSQRWPRTFEEKRRSSARTAAGPDRDRNCTRLPRIARKTPVRLYGRIKQKTFGGTATSARAPKLPFPQAFFAVAWSGRSIQQAVFRL